jgi:hypothetical protein
MSPSVTPVALTRDVTDSRPRAGLRRGDGELVAALSASEQACQAPAVSPAHAKRLAAPIGGGRHATLWGEGRESVQPGRGVLRPRSERRGVRVVDPSGCRREATSAADGCRPWFNQSELTQPNRRRVVLVIAARVRSALRPRPTRHDAPRDHPPPHADARTATRPSAPPSCLASLAAAHVVSVGRAELPAAVHPVRVRDTRQGRRGRLRTRGLGRTC